MSLTPTDEATTWMATRAASQARNVRQRWRLQMRARRTKREGWDMGESGGGGSEGQLVVLVRLRGLVKLIGFRDRRHTAALQPIHRQRVVGGQVDGRALGGQSTDAIERVAGP